MSMESLQSNEPVDQREGVAIVELGTVKHLTGTFNNGKAHDDNNQGAQNRKVPTD